MLSTQRRLFALMVVCALAAAAILVPRIGRAQSSTPSASPVSSPEAASLVTEGEKIYTTVCVACHRPGGAGIEGVYPKLAGDPFVNLDDPHPMVQTVLNGRAGMPTFRSYSNEEIAAVVTYVRQAFGNTAGPVSPDFVQQVRDEFSVPSGPEATPLPGGTKNPGAATPAATPQ